LDNIKKDNVRIISQRMSLSFNIDKKQVTTDFLVRWLRCQRSSGTFVEKTRMMYRYLFNGGYFSTLHRCWCILTYER